MSDRKQLAVIVDWYGPYNTLKEANMAAGDEYKDGLYMVIGRQRYQRGDSQLQYLGISDSLCERLHECHRKIQKVTRERRLWLGVVSSLFGSGRPKLEQVEWAYIYFLQLPLNEKKKTTPPQIEITVTNRWWNKVPEWNRLKRPHEDWPDIIDYSVCHEYARVGSLGSWVEEWARDDFVNPVIRPQRRKK